MKILLPVTMPITQASYRQSACPRPWDDWSMGKHQSNAILRRQPKPHSFLRLPELVPMWWKGGGMWKCMQSYSVPGVQMWWQSRTRQRRLAWRPVAKTCILASSDLEGGNRYAHGGREVRLCPMDRFERANKFQYGPCRANITGQVPARSNLQTMLRL